MATDIAPGSSLAHACRLAPEILVIDHASKSQWAWQTCETEKAELSWRAVRELPVAREKPFFCTQHFRDFAELHGRIAALGDVAVSRIARFAGQRNISIEMRYAIAIIKPTMSRGTEVRT
jgi:hypothetical protein